MRHYDSDEVRKYIAKQRAERKKKLEEEEKARQEAAENRRRQLEELYKKQKETARQPVTGVKSRLDDRQPDGSRHRVSGSHWWGCSQFLGDTGVVFPTVPGGYRCDLPHSSWGIQV